MAYFFFLGLDFRAEKTPLGEPTLLFPARPFDFLDFVGRLVPGCDLGICNLLSKTKVYFFFFFFFFAAALAAALIPAAVYGYVLPFTFGIYLFLVGVYFWYIGRFDLPL